jgi:hypothetical protein
MVRDLGPDRFRQFWQSNEHPRAAFRAVAGRDISEWTRDWAQRTYGVQHRGPGVALSSTGYGVGVILLALLAAVVTTKRRQVA